MWLFLTVPWVDLQCVIVVFPEHAQLLFYYIPINDTTLELSVFWLSDTKGNNLRHSMDVANT